jgi:hypothetical protein
VPTARLLTLTNGAFQENCFLVADDEARAAALVDPGEEAEVFLRRLEREGLTLHAVWLTHAHIDHVLGIGRIVEATGVPVYLHPDDRRLYDGVAAQGSWFGLRVDPLPAPTHELAHGGQVAVGGLAFKCGTCPATARARSRSLDTASPSSVTRCSRDPSGAWICPEGMAARCCTASAASCSPCRTTRSSTPGTARKRRSGASGRRTRS